MKKNPDTDIAAIMQLFMQRLIALDRAEKVCHGVTLSQAYTIGTVHKHGEISMNELSQELGLATSTLTRVNDLLVRDGIVCRNACVADRRKVKVCLTEKGKALAVKLNECSQQFWADIIAAIPVNKREQIVESLELLLNALKGVGQGCCQEKKIQSVD
jgi:DNA-binding MarR family transcriptional regulator